MDQDEKCELTNELLFFDTFTHENVQESNLDLVQFASPIIIDEIRIIPLGARVVADFTGGDRLGATNPSSFDVTFYINDFTKPTVCTFSDFGRFEYKQNINIQFIPEERKPTDGLLIKGSYRVITLAIYGAQTNVKDLIAKEETPVVTPVSDHCSVSQAPVTVDHHNLEGEFQFEKNYTRKDSPDLVKEFNPVLERLNQTANSNQRDKTIKTSSGSKTIVVNNNDDDEMYYSERTKESSTGIRDPEIGSSSANSRDENLDPRRRRKSRSPCSRHFTVDSPHSLSPVRSPQSLKSPMSPQSDISMKYESSSHPRSPLMDHHHKKSSSSSRSPYSRHRTPPILPPPPPSVTPTTIHSNHSPRSPRYIQSRSTSPWYKNQHNPSHPSSPTSPISPRHYRKTHSPRKRTSPAKTPPEESSSYNKKRHRRARTPPSHSPSPTIPIIKRIETENNSSNHSVPILPVNTDLLEEISPEHSLSDWAESISEDENLDDIESGDGEPDENLPISNNITENSVIESNVNNNSYFIHSPPNHHQASESQEPEPFESISSEEEYFEEGGNIAESDRLSHYSDYEMCDETFNATFDPYNSELTQLKVLRDPSKTNYQHLRSNSMNLNEDNENKRTLLLSQLSEMRTLRSSIWVESMENIAKDIELVPLDKPEILSIILTWLQDGLDYDLSIKQTTIPFKVRHIKAGLRLAIALTNTDESIIKKLIELKIPLALINLYYRPYMSLPLKLLILRTFDSLCDSVIGIEHILNDEYIFTFTDPTEEEKTLKADPVTCYQHLLTLLSTKPPSRVANALESLLNKINFYHLLQSFQTQVLAPCPDVLNLSAHVHKIGSTFGSARRLLTQKIRCLPVTCFFEIKEPKCDCYLSIYNWFKQFQFIDNLVILLKNCHSDLLASKIYQLIDILMAEESFPRFLLSSSCCSKANELATLLSTHVNHELYNQSNYVGERLNCLLQSYSLIDSLIVRVQSDTFDMSKCDEDVELCTIFRSFYGLLFSSIGRDCVIRALSSSNHFQSALLPFLLPVSGDGDNKLYKTIWSEYAVKLCLSMVQFGEDNLFHLARNCGNSLLAISKNNQLPKLSTLSDWLKPINFVQNLSYSESTFKELMTIVKNYADLKLKENEIFKLQPQLITILRILYKLCLPAQKSFSHHHYHRHLTEEEPVNELKYFYATIQVHSHDGLSSLLSLLQKLSQTYLRPSHQSFSLVGDQGSLVMAFVKPSVKLVKEILRVLIRARGKDFRDTSPIPVMLKVYSLMYLFPRSSLSYSTSRETIRDIVDILMFYTQFSLTPSESDPEALAKGVWTKMISEVLKYTFSLPMTFVHGLSLLSELLPLPLPFQTLSPLTEEEANKMKNIRKLWSVHLLGLSADLDKLISNFVISSSPTIQQLLRRVCIQISDLSSPASTMMVRSVLEVVLDSLPNEKNPKLSPRLLYVLNLLSYLSTHPPFKMAFIHTMHIGKLDEKYFKIVNKLLRLLREEGTSKPIEVQINHLIFIFLQSLCDSDIYLNSRISSTPNLQILSNSLPPKESLKFIISMLLRFLKKSLMTLMPSQLSLTIPLPINASPSPNFNSILPVLKILSLLCSHDFGFIPLKQGLFEEAPTTLNLILTKIATSIRSDTCKNGDNNELNSAICGFLDFLKFFMVDNEYRSAKLSYKEMVSLLAWESKMSECLIGNKRSSVTVGDENQKQYPEERLKSEDDTSETKVTSEQENNKGQEGEEGEGVEDGDVVMSEISEKLSDKETIKEPEISESTNGASSRTEMDNNLHPLLILNEYLQNYGAVNETEIPGMRNIVKRLLSLLSSPNDECGDVSVNIELPVIEPLPLQFSKREVFVVTSNIDQEKLNTNFWLSVPTFDDDQHINGHHHYQITNHGQSFNMETNSSAHRSCDTQPNNRENTFDDEKRISFIELCQKYLPSDFNLKKTLENLCQTQEDTVDVAKSSNKPSISAISTHQSIRRTGSILSNREPKSFTNVKKSFVAPMRNRGFGRPGAMMHSSRANDPFRSRPPNTSRPPSMHVDDFVALEQSGTNCNTYEAPSKRMKLDYTMKIRNSSSASAGSGGAGGTGGSGGNNSIINSGNSSLLHNSSRSFGGSGSVGSRSSPSYHTIDPYSNRRTLLSSSHSHSHQSPLRNHVPSTSSRNSLTRYSRDSYSPPASRSTRSDSTGPSSSQHWTKSNSTNRRDSRDSRDSRSVRSSNNR